MKKSTYSFAAIVSLFAIVFITTAYKLLDTPSLLIDIAMALSTAGAFFMMAMNVYQQRKQINQQKDEFEEQKEQWKNELAAQQKQIEKQDKEYELLGEHRNRELRLQRRQFTQQALSFQSLQEYRKKEYQNLIYTKVQDWVGKSYHDLCDMYDKLTVEKSPQLSLKQLATKHYEADMVNAYICNNLPNYGANTSSSELLKHGYKRRQDIYLTSPDILSINKTILESFVLQGNFPITYSIIRVLTKVIDRDVKELEQVINKNPHEDFVVAYKLHVHFTLYYEHIRVCLRDILLLNEEQLVARRSKEQLVSKEEFDNIKPLLGFYQYMQPSKVNIQEYHRRMDLAIKQKLAEMNK